MKILNIKMTHYNCAEFKISFNVDLGRTVYCVNNPTKDDAEEYRVKSPCVLLIINHNGDTEMFLTDDVWLVDNYVFSKKDKKVIADWCKENDIDSIKEKCRLEYEEKQRLLHSPIHLYLPYELEDGTEVEKCRKCGKIITIEEYRANELSIFGCTIEDEEN